MASKRDDSDSVRVVVRCRPLSQTEKKNGNKVIVDIDTTLGSIILHKPGGQEEVPKTFTFDSTFDWK